MKKKNVFGKLLRSLAIVLTGCLVLSGVSYADMVSNAGLIPAGYGYTHGRIPVIEATGRPEIHDAAIMRYDRNSRIRDVDNGEVQAENNGQNRNDPQRQQF